MTVFTYGFNICIHFFFFKFGNYIKNEHHLLLKAEQAIKYCKLNTSGYLLGSLGEKVVNKIKVTVAEFCSFEVLLHTCPISFSLTVRQHV